jgi:hypothetical protein
MNRQQMLRALRSPNIRFTWELSHTSLPEYATGDNGTPFFDINLSMPVEVLCVTAADGDIELTALL